LLEGHYLAAGPECGCVQQRRMRAIAALFVALLFAGCSSASTARPADEIVLAESTEWQTLNPLYMFGSSANRLGALIYSQLFRWSADGSLVPSVATQVPTLSNGGISRDGLVITYHLRHDVKWADGAQLTARDVVFTHEAVMNPRNSVVDQRGDDRIASISALDPYTVRVRLKKVYAPFILEFDRPILPAHLLDRFSSLDKVDYNAHPVGSGPYRVLEWRRGDSITFVRNEKYWGARARIDKIKIRYITNARTIVLELQGGDIDGAAFADPAAVAQLASNPKLQVSRGLDAFWVLIFNASHPWLSDPRMRRAIVLALDRERLVKTVTQGMSDPSQPGRALFGWAYDPAVQPLPYDPSLARRLLAAAGWKHGLSLNLVTQSGHPELAIEANEVAQDLKAVGIVTTVELYSDPEYFSVPNGILASGRFDITLSRFGAGDPPYDFNDYLGCNAFGSPTAYNFTHMCMLEVQPEVRDAFSTFDRARQLRDFAIVQRALQQDAPLVILSRAAHFYVSSKRLHGFVATPYGEFEGVTSWWLSSSPQ